MASSDRCSDITDELLARTMLLKLQYGPSNVRTGWVEIATALNGYVIKEEEVVWYREELDMWCCDEVRVYLSGNYKYPLAAKWWMGGVVMKRLSIKDRYQGAGTVWLPALRVQL